MLLSPDERALSAIHTGLAEHEMLPESHLVDAGYVDAANLVRSRAAYGVDLVGPTLKNYWYQAETGYDLTHFSIDREAETVTCPQGRRCARWTPAQDAKSKPVFTITFSQADCKICLSQAAVRDKPDVP